MSNNSWMMYDEKPQVPSVWLMMSLVSYPPLPQSSNAAELVPPISLPSNGDIATSLHEPDYLSNGYEVDPKWEYPRGMLQFSEMVYEGTYTVLYKGVAPGIRGEKPIDVGIKMCKVDATGKEVETALLADMELLASLESHPNVVGLLRVCTVESEQLTSINILPSPPPFSHPLLPSSPPPFLLLPFYSLPPLLPFFSSLPPLLPSSSSPPPFLLPPINHIMFGIFNF